jgi:hypothetical protein
MTILAIGCGLFTLNWIVAAIAISVVERMR